MYTYAWVSDCITDGVERRKTSLHSLSASWLLVMCFHGAAKLTAALPPEQNDIVCTLSLSLPHSSSSSSSSCTRSLPLLSFARLLAAQTAQLSSVPPLPQQILHELCVSEWDGTFKGERNLQGQCVCTSSVCPPLLTVLPCTHPSPHNTHKTPPRIIRAKNSSLERPPPRTHNSPSPFIHFHTTAKAALRYECAQTSMRHSLLHREAISSGALWDLSNYL